MVLLVFKASVGPVEGPGWVRFPFTSAIYLVHIAESFAFLPDPRPGVRRIGMFMENGGVE